MSEQTPDKAGFQIGSQLYPFPESFRLGDPVLITEVTGMAFTDFAEAIDDETQRENPIIFAGLIAVAIWQANPRWKRERVRQFVESLDINAVQTVGGDDEGADPDRPLSSGDEPSAG